MQNLHEATGAAARPERARRVDVRAARCGRRGPVRPGVCVRALGYVWFTFKGNLFNICFNDFYMRVCRNFCVPVKLVVSLTVE